MPTKTWTPSSKFEIFQNVWKANENAQLLLIYKTEILSNTLVFFFMYSELFQFWYGCSKLTEARFLDWVCFTRSISYISCENGIAKKSECFSRLTFSPLCKNVFTPLQCADLAWLWFKGVELGRIAKLLYQEPLCRKASSFHIALFYQPMRFDGFSWAWALFHKCILTKLLTSIS